MNVGIYVLECVIMCILFGVLIMGLCIKNPVSMISDYPPDIQERYYKTQNKEVRKNKMTAPAMVRKIVALIIYFCIFAWMTHVAGGDTFLESLLMVYGYMFILFAFDTFFLDWVLFANIKKLRLPGTEDMNKEYHQKWFHVKACLPIVPIFFVAGFLIAGFTMLVW